MRENIARNRLLLRRRESKLLRRVISIASYHLDLADKGIIIVISFNNEFLFEKFVERTHIKVATELSVDCDRNITRFLRNNYYNGIRIFAHAD